MDAGHFGIYASRTGHYVCTDKVHSEILELTYNHKCTTAEIAERLLLRPVNVNAILKKLVAEGVMESLPDPDDSRRMLYQATAFPLIQRANDTNIALDADTIIKELFNDKYPPYWVFHKLVYTMMKGAGVDIKPLIKAIGWYFGKKAADLNETGDFIGLKNTLIDNFQSYGHGDLSVTVTYYIRVELTGFEVTTERYDGIYEDFCIAFVQRAFECCSGKEMYAVLDESTDVECLAFDLYFKEHQASVHQVTILPDPALADPKALRFSLYDVNGRGEMITDPTKMDIMDQLESGPRSIKEISTALNKSQSAVSADLRDLKEGGFVRNVVSNDTRKNVYALNGRMMLRGIEPRLEMLEYIEEVIENIAAGDVEYNEGFGYLEASAAWTFGIDSMPSIGYLGQMVGSLIARECNPNDFTDVFDRISDLFENKVGAKFGAQLTFFIKATIVKDLKYELSAPLITTLMMEIVRGALMANSGKGMEIRNVDKSVGGQVTFELHFVN